MLFNSTAFMVFLPLVFAAYWLLKPVRITWQNTVLLSASYVFYGWWDWRFLLLLAFSTALDFLAGIMIHEEAGVKRRRTLLWITVALNLGLLGFFKYFNFFIDSAVRVLETLGFQANPWSLNLILPIGISFYTFHGISYVVDVYFRRIKPNRDLLTYGVFVCYFPLLVAGPIERATNLLPQLEKPRFFDYKLAIDGIRIMAWGFFKKLVIADSMGHEVNEIFDSPEGQGGGTLAISVVYFAMQVYCDFSGYTDIARGVSRLFGIEVLENFKTPYLSRSIPEFWSRWHISLSSWLNDYVFTPLAIEFRGWGKHGIFAAVFITFLLSGLWHGPSWHFVAWGALHGLFYLPFVYRKKGLRSLSARKEKPLSYKDIPSILLTFALVCLGYVLFRAESLDQAVRYLKLMFQTPFEIKTYYVRTILNLLIPASFLIDWLSRRNYFTGRYSTWFLVLETVALAAITSIIGNFGSIEFIYFQF
jgi:D-alanyl-lipoteichoic acid acyltransferase DltB (MBOAT superfamily)